MAAAKEGAARPARSKARHTGHRPQCLLRDNRAGCPASDNEQEKETEERGWGAAGAPGPEEAVRVPSTSARASAYLRGHHGAGPAPRPGACGLHTQAEAEQRGVASDTWAP